MRSTADRSDEDGRQRTPDRPLPGTDLRRLFERHTELDQKITQAPTTLEATRARVRMLAKQQDAVRRSIEDYRARLIQATERLAELDRPLLRRRHRPEIDRARAEVTTLPGSIEEARAKLAELERQVPHASRRLGEAEAAVTGLPETRAERALISDALEQDARLRGRDAEATLPAVVLDRIGPSASCGAQDLRQGQPIDNFALEFSAKFKSAILDTEAHTERLYELLLTNPELAKMIEAQVMRSTYQTMREEPEGEPG